MNKKVYIVLISIILIFFVVMFFLFRKDDNDFDTSIVLGDDSVFVLNGKKWFKLSQPYTILNWKKHNIYINNEKTGNYYLWYDNKWYAFDNKKNPVDLGARFLAIKSKKNVDIIKYEISNINNSSYINEVLEDNNISLSSGFTSKYKTVLDLDNDGIEEEIYVISNAFISSENPDKIFSIVFMVKDDTIYPIYTDIKNNTSLNGCKPYINSILDVDNDNKYELIVSCAEYSNSKITDMLYKYDKNAFKILISN